MTFKARLARLEELIAPRIGRDTSNLPVREWTDRELLAALGPAPSPAGWTDEALLALIAAEKLKHDAIGPKAD